uniref:BPL/LPL catalytic domain-containing protein n=2 Tax=Brassica oleracea var. oleracea TaxID=109376 RepID=A0A0D3DBG1_BRAOL
NQSKFPALSVFRSSPRFLLSGPCFDLYSKGFKMSISRAPLMNLVRLKGTPILEQLHLEERLLRASTDNWCIVNDGTNVPTIVMGMSGKPSQLLEVGPVIKDRIPVIKRFTGGGTVIVDKSTLFVSLICNKDDVPSVQPYPRSVMAWSGSLYGEVFEGVDGFQLRENDYVFGDRKFGGNAQSIIRNRWIHHTSFLWDYNVRNMAYLKLPSKVPQYRLERDHTEFVCRMKDYIERSDFVEKTVKAVGKQFAMKEVNIEDIDSYAKGEHVKSTRLLTMEELQEAMASTSQSA